jgi:AcrR family transcriptional regulator
MTRDGRGRLLRAALELFQERGYAGTSFGDIVDRGQAPRGSIYHHFPGGKAQLAAEVLTGYADAVEAQLTRLAGAMPAAAAVGAFVTASRDALVRSGYTRGCPVAAVTLDLGQDDAALAQITAAAFRAWQRILADGMVREGVGAERAARVSTLIVAAVEGALLLARAEGDARPLDAVRDELVGHVAAVVAQSSD